MDASLGDIASRAWSRRITRSARRIGRSSRRLPLLPLAKSFAEELRAAVQRYVTEYQAYFARQNGRQKTPKRQLDPMPRVVLVPGLGLFGLGHNAKDARIAADIAESTVQTITDAEAIGRFESLPENDLFDMEYWSLEQAKLGQNVPKPLAGQVAVITGGGGTIGAATGKLFADNGADALAYSSNVSARTESRSAGSRSLYASASSVWTLR